MPAKNVNQNSNLNIRMSTKIKEWADKSAEHYSMSTSEYVRFLILEDIRRQGIDINSSSEE